LWIWVCNRLSYLRFTNSINLENLDQQTQSSNVVSLVNIPYVHRLQYITFFLWWRPSWIPIDKKKIVWDHAKLIMYVFGSLKFMVSIKFFFISPYKNVGPMLDLCRVFTVILDFRSTQKLHVLWRTTQGTAHPNLLRVWFSGFIWE
jgi:hypothetical protein